MNKKYLKNEYMKTANIDDPFYDVVLTRETQEYIRSIISNYSFKGVNKNLAYDIGAYIGSSIPRIKAMGFNDIVCFEPDPITYRKLSSNYKDDKNILLENLGMSDRQENTTLYSCDRNRTFLNTMHKDWIFQTKHKSLVNSVSEVNISCTTLDTFLKTKDEIPGYAKIDVEGHEYEVIKGLNTKIPLLSFEWISELPEKNNLCLDELLVIQSLI